jgi:hypothetical protein
MPVETIAVAQIVEAGMLFCFGVAWPVDILKTLRVRHVADKSLGFMVLVLAGYLCGLAAKFIRAGDARGLPETVTWLYGLNAFFVMVDIALYVWFRTRPAASSQPAGPL